MLFSLLKIKFHPMMETMYSSMGWSIEIKKACREKYVTKAKNNDFRPISSTNELNSILNLNRDLLRFTEK